MPCGSVAAKGSTATRGIPAFSCGRASSSSWCDLFAGMRRFGLLFLMADIRFRILWHIRPEDNHGTGSQLVSRRDGNVLTLCLRCFNVDALQRRVEHSLPRAGALQCRQSERDLLLVIGIEKNQEVVAYNRRAIFINVDMATHEVYAQASHVRRFPRFR